MKGWRERAADMLQKRGAIAAGTKSAPEPSDSLDSRFLSSGGLHARKRHQRVAFRPGYMRLEPVDCGGSVAHAAGFQYLAVIAPRESDMQKGALV